MHVGLTGATGHLGGLLLQRLVDDPAVTAVTSVARRDLPGPVPPGVRHVRADLAGGDARRALAGVDVLAHLGFQLWSAGGPAAMAATNLGGTTNVLAGRPGAVVLASSAAVYGAWPDNPLPLPEDHPPRPNRECPYAVHKLAVEARCAEAAPAVLVRLAAVLGPHADPAVARSVAGYRLAVPAVRGVRQALQLLAEDDAAAALHAAVRAAASGTGRSAPLVANVAPADWLDAPAIAATAGSRVVQLPRRVLLAAAEAGRRLRLSPFGADRAVLVDGPLALAAGPGTARLGWSPRRSTASVLAEALGRPQPVAGRR